MKRKPKRLWANKINLAGLYSTKPVLVVLKTAWQERMWTIGTYWDATGDVDVEKEGEVRKYGSIIFASRNKKDVQNWTKGILAVNAMLKKWIY